jgi:lipopolysaccharide cholinephosphotransferase
MCFAGMISSCERPDQSVVTVESVKALTYMEADAVQDLYQMLKDTSEIFERAGIRYSASSGTVLGMMRHGGLIPWDDDADLVILHEDELKLNDVRKAFDALGYHIVCDPWDSSVYRISKIGNPIARDKKITFPFIDVATVALNPKEKKVMYVNWKMLQYFPTEWFKPEAFFPLSKRAFGPIQLYCVHDPEWYLTHYYGADWKKAGRIVPRHYKPKHADIFEVSFETHPEYLTPALPATPLLDRVTHLPECMFK